MLVLIRLKNFYEERRFLIWKKSHPRDRYKVIETAGAHQEETHPETRWMEHYST
jgi:hypothetical protein